jgi:hypothetical protein
MFGTGSCDSIKGIKHQARGGGLGLAGAGAQKKEEETGAQSTYRARQASQPARGSITPQMGNCTGRTAVRLRLRTAHCALRTAHSACRAVWSAEGVGSGEWSARRARVGPSAEYGVRSGVERVMPLYNWETSPPPASKGGAEPPLPALRHQAPRWARGWVGDPRARSRTLSTSAPFAKKVGS